MKIEDIKDFGQLEKYLRTSTITEEDAVYDFGGAIILLCALLDNIREHGLPAEIEEIGYRFTDEQRQFLAHLATCANKITDQEIENEDPN